MPSLLDMPEIAMKLILEKSDFCSILNLRKSCQALRNFINDVKPELHLPYLHIKVHLESIQVTVPLGLQNFDIFYQKQDDGCIIRLPENRKKVLKKSNFLDTVSKDLQIMLGFVKLDFFMVQFEAPNLLKNLLENLSKKLPKVKNFMLIFSEESQISDFLPILDPLALEKLTITNGLHNFNILLDLEKLEISKFQNCKELHIRRCYIKPSIGDLLRFKKINVSFRELSAETVIEFKEAFLHSSHLEHFNIIHQNWPVLENMLVERLGRCSFFDPTTFVTHWIFEIPEDSRKSIDLSVNPAFVCLSRIDKV